jgi:hypothetical protein
MIKGKWCYSYNGENFEGLCDTREEAIEEAIFEYGEDYNVIYVGRAKEVNLGVRIDWIIEQIGEDAYEQVGEYAEDYLRDVKQEHARLLKERFDNVLHQWLDEFGYKPNFWTVVDVEKIKINQ